MIETTVPDYFDQFSCEYIKCPKCGKQGDKSIIIEGRYTGFENGEYHDYFRFVCIGCGNWFNKDYDTERTEENITRKKMYYLK